MTKTLGLKIKKFFRKKDITQREIASKLKKTEQQISAFLGGYYRDRELEKWFDNFVKEHRI